MNFFERVELFLERKTKNWKAKVILKALIQIYPRIVLLTILFLFSSSLIRFRAVKISFE